MSTLIEIKRQQRWIVNAQLLCDLIADEDNLVKVIQTCDEATLWLNSLIDIFQQAVDPVGSTDQSELQDYRIEACTAYDKEYPTITTWQYNEDSLNRQIDFELGCLSPYARHIARKLEADATLNSQNELANPEIKAKYVTQSIIFKMIKLSYLNRKVCLMAENLPADIQQNILPTTPLFRLFINAQRVRCSSFNKREARPAADANFQAVKRHYKNVLKNHDRPFNAEVHRQRVQDRDAVHSDRQLLALNAGASITTRKAESTLGHIASKVGLPERCDISGTTTDAIGAAITWCSGNSEMDCSKRAAYVLACITTMCLMGHHSLAEMATAASLWSKHNYKPFKSNSIWQILSSLCDENGANVTVDANKVLAFKQSHSWIEGKWRTLKINQKHISDDIEFNDELWNLVRIMI